MKLVKEHLIENKNDTSNMDDLAFEFITDVLKLGTADNLFDKFLVKKKLDKSYLNDLVTAVTKRIQKKWL